MDRLDEGTRKIARASFKKRVDWLSLLLSEVSELAFVCARDGIRYMNEPFQKLTGKVRIEMGQPFAALFSKKDRKRAGQAAEKALSGKTVECELPLGLTPFVFRIKPLLESGEVLGFYGVGQAVLSCGLTSESKLARARLEELIQERTAELINTNELLLGEMLEREKAEKALMESEKKYKDLLEAAHDAIFVADASTGTIIHANSKASELVGRPLEELIGLHQTKLHAEEDAEHYKSMFQERVRMRVPYTGGIQYVRHRDGRKIPVRIGTTIATFGNRLIIHGIFRDLSRKTDAKNS